MNSKENDTLNPVDKVLCLQNVHLFKHVTTEMLAYIGSIAHEVNVSGGATIFCEEDVSDALYVVLSGRVRLEKDGKEVLTTHESQTFGTWALFDNQPRLMTAVAVDDVRLLKISRDDFYELLSDHDEITPAIFRAVVERVKNLTTYQYIENSWNTDDLRMAIPKGLERTTLLTQLEEKIHEVERVHRELSEVRKDILRVFV